MSPSRARCGVSTLSSLLCKISIVNSLWASGTIWRLRTWSELLPLVAYVGLSWIGPLGTKHKQKFTQNKEIWGDKTKNLKCHLRNDCHFIQASMCLASRVKVGLRIAEAITKRQRYTLLIQVWGNRLWRLGRRSWYRAQQDVPPSKFFGISSPFHPRQPKWSQMGTFRWVNARKT